MKNLNKKILITAVALSFSTSSFAGAATGGATEPTQIMNNVELILANAQLVEEVVTTKNQLDTMVTNLKKLANFKENNIDIIDKLQQLEQIIQYGQSLAYNANNLATQFENRFSDYSEYAAKIAGSSPATSATRYQDWSRQNLDNINSALQSANLQSKYFKTESQRIKEIEHQAKTAVGRDQLLQAGIEMATLQSGQMIRLRQLISSDMQMQANYQASLVDRQAESDAHRIKAISGDINDNIGPDKTYSADEGIFGK